MGNLEQFLGFAQNHQEELEAGRNAAQFDLAQGLDMDISEWIERYSVRFAEIVGGNPNILEKLAKPETYNETLGLLREKLYH